MRVLHVVRQFSPAVGGLENFVLCLARAQRTAGLDAEVLTLDRVFHRDGTRLPARDNVEGIPVRRVAWRGSTRYPLAPGCLWELGGHDLIHVHGLDFFADYLALTRRFHGTPMVISTHGGFFHSGFAQRAKRIYFNTISRASLRAYRRVIACSEGDRALFEPLCRDRLELVENGVDIRKFAACGALRCAPSLLFVGRFSDNKRLDRLLAATDHLVRLATETRLTIAGRDWDGNLARIRQHIDMLGLAKNVQVLVDPSDAMLRAQFAQHSFVVSASEYEGFGLALVEGMSAGLPPICSDIPSFRRIVADAGVGRLVDFGDPSAAAATIMEYVRSLESGYGAARNQAMAAAARYGWDSVSTRFARLYEHVLGARRRVIQGVAIDTRTGAEIIALVDDAVARRAPLKIAIANAHTINLARGAPDYRALLRDFLVLNDGSGVNIASRWKYDKPFRENLNGTDFVPRLLEQSKRSLSIYMLGARPQVADRALRLFAERFPRHRWLGCQHGYYPPADEAAVCARVREAQPDLVLVALGNPLQEQWIARNARATGAPVCLGVGALFDFVGGTVPRAPLWMRRIGCEWMFRLALEPARMWRRYLVGNLRFLWAARGDLT